MDSIAIFPVVDSRGVAGYQAVAGAEQSQGKTAGEALDLIRSQLSSGASGTLVVIQPTAKDEFFGNPQRSRLQELMRQWRAARDQGISLSANDQSELQGLVELELQ